MEASLSVVLKGTMGGVLSLCGLMYFLLYCFSYFESAMRSPHHLVWETPVEQEAEGYKVILMWTTLFEKPNWFWHSMGTSPMHSCPEHRCIVTRNRERAYSSDAVVFHMQDVRALDTVPFVRSPNQRWVFLSWEAPPMATKRSWPFLLKPSIDNFDGLFNWTITYRLDSDLSLPYGYKVEIPSTSRLRDYAAEKPKLVLWYVSNCWSRGRLAYANELKKYIPLDTYGKCGETDPCNRKQSCVLDLKREYKFYLAFENARCKDYITEKFWRAFDTGMVPIAMGASMETYKTVAPPDSFLHVDNFTSPKDLAKYLRYLHKDRDAYNKYHKWRLKYSVKSIIFEDTICKLCIKLHKKDTATKVYNISKYWGEEENCW